MTNMRDKIALIVRGQDGFDGGPCIRVNDGINF